MFVRSYMCFRYVECIEATNISDTHCVSYSQLFTGHACFFFLLLSESAAYSTGARTQSVGVHTVRLKELHTCRYYLTTEDVNWNDELPYPLTTCKYLRPLPHICGRPWF